jgi:hypothetical protein
MWCLLIPPESSTVFITFKKLKMVKVIGVESRKNSADEEFHLLVLQGNLEMVTSKETGRVYATARKVSIPSTFDLKTAKSFIGTSMNGSIQKVPCEPYEYETDSGETVELSHTWQYNAEHATMEEVVMGDYELTEA